MVDYKSQKSVGLRIQNLRKRRGLSQAELADSVGVAQTSISAYEKGETLPRPPVIHALGDALDASEGWLLTGAGAMRPEAVEPEAKGDPVMLKEGEGEPAVLEMKEIPVMAGEAALGEPTVVRDRVRETVRLPRHLLPHPSLCYALRVNGESMAPLIEENMLVVLDRARRDPYMLRGRIVAARYGEGVSVKRLIEQDGRFHIVADNPRAEFRSVELDFRGGNPVLGEVVCIVR